MGVRVLIVDDDLSQTSPIVTGLEEYGYHVSLLPNPTKLQNVLTSNQTDVILIKVPQNDEDHRETIELCRSKHCKLELPILVFGEKPQKKDLATAIRYGANDFLISPLSPYLTMIRLETHLDLAKLHNNRLQFKEDSVTEAMVVTFNHQINNALTVAYGRLGKLNIKDQQQELKNLKTSLNKIKEIVKEISNFTIEKPTLETYIGKTSMFKAKKKK